MSVGRIMAIAAVVAFFVYLIWTWDLSDPTIDWQDTPETIGKTGRLSLRLEDPGKGLRQVMVAVEQAGQRQVLLDESYAGSGWPWQDRTPQRSVAVSLETAQMPMLAEGPFRVQVRAVDQPNLWLFSRSTEDTRELTLDQTPPTLAVLSSQHNIRQGGSDLIVYRSEAGVAASGGMVGENGFRGYPLTGAPEGTFAVIVGMAYDQPPDTRIAVWAEDQAGNRSERNVPYEVLAGRFRKRRIDISDSFIDSVAPEILARSDEVQGGSSKLETFLAINARLREINHEFIRELSERSAGRLLWNEPFRQLSNSQVEALFADQRTYYYDGKAVDEQTHQGFDLASTAQSPVEAANAGKVLWADYLGIYGNCVILDHGLGLLSLYGHLSSIDVAAGDDVQRGQSLGRTGRTGLAGGDHLHFSTIAQGVQVNPLEWWDEKWLENHVFNRLEAARTAPE